MITLEVFLRERAEEIRSRLSLMRCTLSDLKRDYFVVFDRFLSKDLSPPYLFPVSTFTRLESYIDNLRSELENFNLNSLTYDIARYLNKWNNETRGILCEISRLQNVLSQRISGIGKSKLLEHQRICEVEYGTLSKAYIAVDAFTFDLVKRTFGLDWVKHQKYVPISSFDDRGYMINLYSYIISIPHYDNFRSRFWPILAHEVAHILVSIHARTVGALHDAMLDGQEWLIDSLGLDLPHAALQISELTSDIVSAYVCPTSFLAGLECNSMRIPIERVSGELIHDFRFRSSHPPSDSRLAAMERVLELQNIIDWDANLREINRSAKVFFSRKNLTINSLSCDFIEEYNDFARDYSEHVLRNLPYLGTQGFNHADWETANQSLCDPDNDPPSPIHTLACVWIKRLNKTKGNGRLALEDFFRKRSNETKTFEYAVEQMYKYYEIQIIPKIKVAQYDLRFDFS